MPASETEINLPQRSRIYKTHSLDSTAWDGFTPRTGDVIITTALKAGTTWMQTIVGNLIFQGQRMPGPLWQLTPWLDSRGGGTVQEKLGLLEAQDHRRFIKTHLPLDAMPFFPQVKYIFVGRDGRDIYMSLWNHYRNLQPHVIEWFNSTPERAGNPFPPCPEDIHEFFHMWISKSWFDWEHDGYPFWSAFYHLQSWWEFRHLPNLLFVHFNDLLGDLDGQMHRIADFLGINQDQTIWPAVVHKATFQAMKAEAEEVVFNRGDFLIGGAKRFIYKGTNGRWKGVLKEVELHLYEKAATERLSPEAKTWLEFGNSVNGI